MTDPVRAGFAAHGVPNELVDALLEAYDAAKRRFHLGDFMPNAVEGGRFCEAALHVLQLRQSGTYTPLGDPKFNTQSTINALEPDTTLTDEMRFHLPRSMRVIYDIRNKRGTGHLGDGSIDPNLMDATLVIGVMDWVMAELVRIHRAVAPEEAQAIIDGLVQREVPVIEEIAGHPVLNKDLDRGGHTLVLLYRAGQRVGLNYATLMAQMRVDHKGNLKKTLDRLGARHLVHTDHAAECAYITTPGIKYVEGEGLLDPE